MSCDELVNHITNLARARMTRTIHYQIKLRDSLPDSICANAAELEIRSNSKVQAVYLRKWSILELVRHSIMAMVCAKLAAHKFNVSDATTTSPHIMTESNATKSTPQQKQQLNSSPSVMPIMSTHDLLSLSVSSVLAMCDARDKAKEELDRETFHFVRQRIIDGQFVSRIRADNKRGYQVCIGAHTGAAEERFVRNIRDIIPLLQADVGPTDQVTIIDDLPGRTIITVMEL